MNGWVNNREAGELRRQRAHYDVIVMISLAVFRRTPLITSQRWFKHQAIIRANDNQVSCYYSYLDSSAGVAGSAWPETYHQTSKKSRTKYSNLNVSCFVLQLPLPSLLKPGIKSRMEMWLEQRRQHLSDQQFYCLLRCDLYQRFDFTCRDSVSMKNTTANIQIIFYTPVWKTGRIMPWQCPSVCPSVRPSVRVFRTFLQHALRYQFETWYIHSVGGTTCRVWVASQLGHFDLVYSQK